MNNAGKVLIKPKSWRFISGVYLIIIMTASLNPWFRPRSENNFWSPDKWLHFAAYLFLSLLMGLAVAQLKKNSWLIILGIATVVGAGLEVIQGLLLPFRTFSFYDLLSNLAGAALGVFVVKLKTISDIKLGETIHNAEAR